MGQPPPKPNQHYSEDRQTNGQMPADQASRDAAATDVGHRPSDRELGDEQRKNQPVKKFGDAGVSGSGLTWVHNVILYNVIPASTSVAADRAVRRGS